MISGIAHLFMMVKGCAVNKGQTPARFLMVLKMNGSVFYCMDFKVVLLLHRLITIM